MKHIRDLHFQKEILPLFDSVSNEFSRNVLIDLLSTFPASLEEVYLRQDILKGFLQQPMMAAPFSYSRAGFSQVYDYERGITGLPIDMYGPSLFVHLLFSRRERDRKRGHLSQFYIFLSKLNEAYFPGIRMDLFPAFFADKIKGLRSVLSELGIGKYAAIARGRGFTIGELDRQIRLLAEMSKTGRMDAFWQDLFLFEAYLSIARGIRKHDFRFPFFTEDKGLTIQRFYHPLVKDPVKNSIAVTECVTLITGPNMSGKSTLLKSIGLCVLLAHLGLAVPAEVCELDFFPVISIAIDLTDDIRSGYSHFMTEVKTLKNVVEEAHRSKKCFAIFDELFRGTNVEDALAISKTTLLGLTAFRQSCFFISTHLHQLREAIAPAGDKIGVHYLDCRLEQDRPVFSYTLRQGWSDLRIGQLIFEQEGLNELLVLP